MQESYLKNSVLLTLSPTLQTLDIVMFLAREIPLVLNPKPETRNPKPEIRSPVSLFGLDGDLEPPNPNPEFKTLNPAPPETVPRVIPKRPQP